MTTSTRFTGWVLGAAAVAMGLAAGSFYVFACAVMPALARSGDRTYVEVMRNINDVIQNPVFFLSLIGSLVFTGYAAWRLRRQRGPRGWVFAALVCCAVAFLVTMTVNVPLNDALAAGISDPARAREDFEDPWVTWNVVRAVLCTGAVGCLVRALHSSPSGGSHSSPSGD